LASLGGGLLFAGASLSSHFNDPSSDYNVKREAAAAVVWIRRCMYDARVLREDFKFKASSYTKPFSRLEAQRSAPNGTEFEYWDGRNIAFQVERTGVEGANYFQYNHVYQTLSPGLKLRVYKKNGDKYEFSNLYVTISVYGMARLRSDG
jgi:hypothetical protein